MNETLPSWKVGDSVQIDFADIPDAKVPGNTSDKPSVPDRGEANVVGIVGKITSDGIAYVVEIHSFHRVWGGSNVSRGKVIEVPLSVLEECQQYYRALVREQRDNETVRNVLDELLAPEHP